MVGRSGGSLNSDTSLYSSLFVDRFDNIFVTDSEKNRVTVFTFHESRKICSDYQEFVHLLVDRSWIKQPNLCVLHFGEKGSAEGQFKNPSGICVDNENGAIFVADSDNHRIQVFNENGKYLRSFGEKERGTGQLDTPKGTVLTSENQLIISEKGNNRIQIFDYFGIQIGFINLTFTPDDLCLDLSGNLYIVAKLSPLEAEIQVFDLKSQELIHSFGKTNFKAPTEIAFDPLIQANKVFLLLIRIGCASFKMLS